MPISNSFSDIAGASYRTPDVTWVREFILERNCHADLGQHSRHVFATALKAANLTRYGRPDEKIFMKVYLTGEILKQDFSSKNKRHNN
jgi:hypothetical protein